MTDDLTAALPKDLPGPEYIMSRVGNSDALRSNIRPALAQLCPSALWTLSIQTEIRFPAALIQLERVYNAGKVPYIVPSAWPVLQIIQAYQGASTAPLRVGTELDLVRGHANLAIAQPNGDRIRFAGICASELFITYRAGMDKLPADLLDVFYQLVLLMWNENGRSGMTKKKTDVGEDTFTRQLPDWAKKTLNSYRRIASFV